MTDPATAEERARELLPPEVFDYYAGGSGTEVSLGEAEAAWRRWRLRPRVLRDVLGATTETTLFGTTLRTPVLVAPTAFHTMAHPDGEVASATGTQEAGSLLVVSTRAGRRIEDVAATGVPWWLQVYLTRDRRLSDGLVDRAAAAGAGALVLTGDTPYVGRKARAGGPLPLEPDVVYANLLPHLLEGLEIDEAASQDPSATFADVAALQERTGLPVLVKGVLRGDDAIAAVEAGAAGIIVSNHGGRQLDRAVATAVALPEVVAAVGDRVPVLVDGGVRHGIDALVALALGASAVLVGRPVLWGLVAGGADGVGALLDDLTGQLLEAMELAGAVTLADLTPDLLTPSPS